MPQPVFRTLTLNPRRRLVAFAAAATVVPLATLFWLGWRVLDSDRVIETSQLHDHVEHGADAVVSALLRVVMASEDQLLSGRADLPVGTVIVATTGARLDLAVEP